LAKAFGVASLILFTRLLTKQEMAAFPIFLMLAGLCDLILTFGIFSQVLRELPSLWREDQPGARSLVVTSSAIILAGTTIPAVIAFVWCSPIASFVFRDPTQGWVISLMAPGFIAYVISRIVDYIMWGRGQFGATSILQILESIIRPVCTIALYFVMGYAGVVIGLIISQFVMAGLGFYYVRDLFLGPLPRIYPVRKLIIESLPYYIGNYLSYLRGDGDVLVVTSFLGPSKLAEYYVAKTLYVNVSLVLTALDKVAVERLARFVRTGEFVEKIKELFAHISQITVPFVLFTITITPYAMTVLAGSRYSGVSWTAIVLLLGALVQFVSIPVDRAVYLIVPGFVRVSYAVVESLAIMISAVALVPLAGLVGVAGARVFAFTLTMLFGMFMLRRRSNLELSLFPAVSTLAAAVPGTLLVLLTFPSAHTTGQAFIWSAVAAAAWCSLFAAFTYIINRQAFDNLIILAREQYRTYFPA